MQLGAYHGLLAHMEWADAITWKSLLGLEAARGDAPVADKLYHLHTVHWAYLQVWRGEPMQIPERGTFGDLAAILTWARPYYPALRAFADTLDEAALLRPIEFPWADEFVKRGLRWLVLVLVKLARMGIRSRSGDVPERRAKRARWFGRDQRHHRAG